MAVSVIPIVVRITEATLRPVPPSPREAAAGLGALRWKVTVLVCYPAARDGILTGVLLAVARIGGETAPLLFTGLGKLDWSLGLGKPMSSLPVTINQYAGLAFNDWVQFAWIGAPLITAGVPTPNIIAQTLLRERQ